MQADPLVGDEEELAVEEDVPGEGGQGDQAKVGAVGEAVPRGQRHVKGAN